MQVYKAMIENRTPTIKLVEVRFLNDHNVVLMDRSVRPKIQPPKRYFHPYVAYFHKFSEAKKHLRKRLKDEIVWARYRAAPHLGEAKMVQRTLDKLDKVKYKRKKKG